MTCASQLAQTMLQDQDDVKTINPLNPLRKAMRRRNVKKVEFSATASYLEPEDIVYSSSEDEDDETGLNGHEQQEQEEQRQEQVAETDQDATVAPLNPHRGVNGKVSNDGRVDTNVRNGIDGPNGVDHGIDSDDAFEHTGTCYGKAGYSCRALMSCRRRCSEQISQRHSTEYRLVLQR